MTPGTLSRILTLGAKNFYKSQFEEVVIKFSNSKINKEPVEDFIISFLSSVKVDFGIRQTLADRLEKYSSNSFESIKRNVHMNNFDGSQLFSKNNAEAILVDYVNYAVLPLDLAFYTSDLK